MRYWIGGSPCAGKSSVARLLAERHGLAYAECDALAPPRPPGLPKCDRLALPPEQQAADEIAYYRAQFPALLPRLPAHGIIEGADLLPDLVPPAAAAIWLIPTPTFQEDHYRQRPWASAYVAECPDPARAFAAWMRRDVLFAQHVRAAAEARGGRVILVDGTRSPDRIAHLAEAHLGL